MKSKKLLAVVLCVVLCVAMLLTSCNNNNNQPTTKTEKRVVNDNYTLIIQENTYDGVFNPFFYSNAYDGEVLGLVQVGLLTMDATGAVVAGDNYDTLAKSYEIFYTDDLTNFTKKADYAEGDYVVYEMVIKNGAKFSDGQPISADDALFNYYVYLDPAYDGSSTLYTLPILGLSDYRTQVQGSSTYSNIAAAIFANGEEYKASDVYTEEQFNAYWAAMEKAGNSFAAEIVNYVKNNYGGEADYAGGNSKYSGKTAIDFSVEGQKIAFGMSMWGFGKFDSTTTYSANDKGIVGKVAEDSYKNLWTKTDDEDAASFADVDGNFYVRATADTATADCVWISASGDDGYEVTAFSGERFDANTVYADTFTAACTGKNYDMVNEFPTIADYWENLKLGYADDDGVVDYIDLSDTESAGMDLVASASEGFTKAYANEGSVQSISGLVKGTTTIDGTEYETVKVILTEQNPKAILSLGVTIAPKHYYTAGYTYTEGAVVNYGVELGLNTTKFMDHLKTFNTQPLGSGSYAFEKFENGDVYLVRNEYHETMGDDTVYNANIKNVCMKVVDSGAEFNALKAGDVHFATVSSTADVVSEIADNAKLQSILVDNLGYGYICINPAATEYGLDNLYARIALTTVFDMEKVKDYYPSGLADIIYRSQSQVSWAYPEGATAIYPYDETLASAIANFKLAGYTYDEATGKFTDVPAYDFYLPSDAKDHPAGGIYIKAQELLATIGVTVNIKSDSNLIANIKTSAIPVYSLAWSSSADPDMYQVYHYNSAAGSVEQNGIKGLYSNSSAVGTITVTKLDGTTAEMNQKDAIKYLGDLIELGTKYMNKEERQPIYTKALEVLAQLSIEVPTYQRKNMYAYDQTILDGATMSQNVTPYWGPLAQIWKLSFASGVEGNTEVEVQVTAD